jgi:acyl-coenzyme A synthetase/AMP-(fatty) acid ligase
MLINFFSIIYQTLQQNRQNELIVWPSSPGVSKSYTGKELLQKVAASRAVLLSKGVNASQAVLLAVPVSVDLICALLAVQSIGAVPVLPPASESGTGILKLIKEQGIRFVLVADKLGFMKAVVSFLGKFKFVILSRTALLDKFIDTVNVPPEQAALISHSSGSTGNPKAVFRSHRVLLAQHHLLKEVFPLWPDQIDFPLFPNILLHNLAAGVKSVMPHISGFKLNELDPALVVDQLVNNKVQTLTGNVYYFTNILAYLRKNRISFPRVRSIGIGGSPVPEILATSLKIFFINADVYIIYGSSEAEPIAVRKVIGEPMDPMAGYKVGKANKNLQLEISQLGEVLVANKIYSVGEIKVKGTHVAVANIDSMLATGDYGYLNEQNEIYLTGRKGNETIKNHIQHYQLEHLLLNDERVEKAAAIAVDDGFSIFVQGDITGEEILVLLGKQVSINIIKSINKRDNIPVDTRHLSKILYDKVC